MDYKNRVILSIFLCIALIFSCKKEVDIKYYKGMVRADLMLKMNDYQQAIMISNKVLEEVPDYDFAHFVKGKALYLSGRLEESKTSLARVISLNSEYPDAHFLLGNVEGQLGNFTKAVELYNQELSLLNADSTLDKQKFVFLQIGRACTELGNSEKALEAFDKVLEIDSTFADVYNEKGQVKEDEGELEEALKLRKKALLLNPDGDYHYQIGLLLVNLGRYKEAISYLEKAKLKHPNFHGVYYNMGRSLIALNKDVQGEQLIAKADSMQNRSAELAEARSKAEIDGTLKSWLEYARMLHKDNRYQESFSIVKRLMKEYPNNKDVKDFIEKAGRYE